MTNFSALILLLRSPIFLTVGDSVLSCAFSLAQWDAELRIMGSQERTFQENINTCLNNGYEWAFNFDFVLVPFHVACL